MVTLNNDRRRLLGNVLIGVGLLLMLIAGLNVLWPQYESQQTRARLLAEPPQSIRRLVATATATPTEETLANGSSRLPILATAAAEVVSSTPETNDSAPGSIVPQPTEQARGASLAAKSPAAAGPTRTPEPTRTRRPTRTPTQTPTPIPPSPPARIVIPDLGMDVRVMEMSWKVVPTARGPVSEWQIPEDAAGHANNSARMGEPGNVVISGHNNIYGRVFQKISEAWGGETEQIDTVTERSPILDGRLIELYAADGRKVDYVITGFFRVKDSGVPLSQRIANAQYIRPTKESRLTVTTCWPPWNNTHRLIIIAELAE